MRGYLTMLDGKKAIAYMKAQGWRILALNIIYLEGINPDGSLNNDVGWIFNDLRTIIKNDGSVVLAHIATTEPGRYYTQNPMNSKGAARIAFGNYEDTWAIGRHHTQDALVQVAPVKVYRDLNKDGLRTGDKTDTGLFGINQHTTGSVPPLEIGKWSAGCLVGRSSKEHAEFMKCCRSMGKNRFDTTVIDASKIA